MYLEYIWILRKEIKVKKFLYAICGASALGFASTMLGNTMMTFGSTGSFDQYFIPFLLFYVFYFVDKYFFRIFLSISKTRSALGAGIINGVCSVVVFALLYYFAQFSVQESISFMCIPDIYCAFALQFQDMRPMPFYAVFGAITLLKLFILMNVFEEKKSWIAPLIVLILARLAQLVCVYYMMNHIHKVVEYLLQYMPLFAVMGTMVISLVVVDYVCSLFFKSREEDF